MKPPVASIVHESTKCAHDRRLVAIAFENFLLVFENGMDDMQYSVRSER